jgi:hypothetical protein
MATYIYIRGFNYKELIEVTLKVPLLLICDGNIYIYIYIYCMVKGKVADMLY